MARINQIFKSLTHLIISRKKLIISAFIILCLVAIFTRISSVSRESDYTTYMEQAQAYFTDREYYEAMSAYQEAIFSNPREHEPYLNLANIYQLKNNSEMVINVLTEGVKKASEKDPLYLALGVYYQEQSELNSAEHAFNNLDDAHTQKALKLAEVYLQQNETEKALERITDLISPPAQYLKILAYLFREPYRSLEIIQLANFNNQHQEIVSQLESILSQKESTYRQLLLAQQVVETKYPALVIDTLEMITSDNPNYRDGLLVMGNAYFKIGEVDKALASWEKARESDPVHGQSFYLLAQYYLSQKKYSKAQSQAEKAVYLENTNLNFYQLLSFTYDKQDLCDQKVANQEKIVNELTKWQSPDELTQNQVTLVTYYHDCQKTDEALALSEKLKNSLSEEKLTPRIKELYLWSQWLKTKNTNESVAAYADFILENPFNARGYWHYGEILEISGDSDSARINKDRAVELEII